MAERKRIPGPAGYCVWECRDCCKDTAMKPCYLQVEDSLYVPQFCAFSMRSSRWRHVR